MVEQSAKEAKPFRDAERVIPFMCWTAMRSRRFGSNLHEELKEKAKSFILFSSFGSK